MRPPRRSVRRVSLFVLWALAASLEPAFAQNWSFDARDIGLGGVSGTANLATRQIDERRKYTAILLPFGLAQILSDTGIYNADSKNFDPIRVIEYVASPLQFVVGRTSPNSAEALFVSDLRNANLTNTRLSKYHGFVPANDLLGEGLLDPSFGHTFKIRRSAKNAYQGIYAGAAPYFSFHATGTIDQRLTNVLATGVDVPNAAFPIANTDQVQLAYAIIGGYRGRFPWSAGVGSGSEHNGLFVAANYKYLRGFAFQDDEIAVRLATGNTGLVTGASDLTVTNRYASGGSAGSGFALDVGMEAVIDRWEFGIGANGVGNRIDWRQVTQEIGVLQSLTSGDKDLIITSTTAAADTRIQLPVDVRAQVKYYADGWSTSIGGGRGFGGASFHGGVERRFNRIEVRGGLRYTFGKWNPAGGVGFDLNPRISFDLAAFGTNTNVERKRQMAIAASVRFNRRPAG